MIIRNKSAVLQIIQQLIVKKLRTNIFQELDKNCSYYSKEAKSEKIL